MRVLVIYLCVVLCGSMARAISIGSNSAVSRNSFFVFPATDSDNAVFGFASMDDGFLLEDSTTTCLFSSMLPVRKQLYLNGGTLVLDNDISLDNMTSFTNIGNITALDATVSRRIILAPSINMLGYTGLRAFVFSNIDLLIGGDITIQSPIQFEGTCMILGSGKSITIADGAYLSVTPGSSLMLQDVIIENLTDGQLVCQDNTGNLILTAVSVIQQNNAFISFDTGSISIQGHVSFSGTGTFLYDSQQTSTIAANSEWLFGNGMCFQVAKNAISGAQPLAFIDSTSVLGFDNTNFAVGPTGLLLTNGKARFDRNVSFQFATTSTQNGVIFGTGNPGQDFTLEFGPAAIVNLLQGYFTYNNHAPNLMISVSNTASIICFVNSYMFVAQNLILSNIAISLPSLTVPPITVNTGKKLSFNPVRIALPTAELDLTGQQSGVGSNLLAGNGTVFLNKGTMPFEILVSSINNYIAGQGIYASPIIFSASSAAATWAVTGQLNALLTLNGGTLTIASGMILGTSGSLVGPGIIILGSQTVQMPAVASTWSTPLFWQGSGKIALNNTLTLLSTWTLTGGICTIDGQANILDLTAGNLVIGHNTQLILKDVILKNVSGTNISCVDNTASLLLDNVKWVQDANFTFTQGAIQFRNKTVMRGAYVFAYQTVGTSTVLEYAALRLDPGFTFLYDPPVAAGSATELQFFDDTAEFILNGGSLIATGLGISFTAGTLRVRLTSSIGSRASTDFYGNVFNNGIIFGDGVNPANDMQIIIYPQVELVCSQGTIYYENLNAASVSMQHYLSALHMYSGSILNLLTNFYTGLGRIIFEDGTSLRRQTSADVIGAIEPRGVLIRN